MASNNAFKITKDTSTRKNTRVGSIQSAVEAAAMKESHDYYVNRLTEGYKQQLETMEQGYEEQIKELKAQFAATVEKAKEEAVREVSAKAANDTRMLKTSLSELEAAKKRDDATYGRLTERVRDAERDRVREANALRSQMTEERNKYEARLDKAQRASSSGPHRWIEIKFTRKCKTKMSEPKFMVKKGFTKFSELVQAATFLGKVPDSWVYEYRGRQVSDTSKTLAQVSGSLTHEERSGGPLLIDAT